MGRKWLPTPTKKHWLTIFLMEEGMNNIMDEKIIDDNADGKVDDNIIHFKGLLSDLHNNIDLIHKSNLDESDMSADTSIGSNPLIMPAIETFNLIKRFGNTLAVENLNISVRRNEIYGFLGPNGAGKTTTIRMLTTILPPTEGTAKIAGYDIRFDAIKVRKKIAVVLQRPALSSLLTVYDNLDFFGKMYGISKNERQEKIKFLLSELDLWDFRNKKVEKLSRGQQRIVQVLKAFLPEVEILFLDEPTVGLDPHSKRTIWNFIKKCKLDTTIFLTTQSLEEAEYLCSKIAIFQKGQILVEGSLEDIRKRYGREFIEFVFKESVNIHPLLAEIDGISIIKTNGITATIQVGKADEVISQILERLINKCIQIKKMQVKQSTLEDIFIDLTKGRK
jgi:ABC-2 type transport system ATP-binding protein